MITHYNSIFKLKGSSKGLRVNFVLVLKQIKHVWKQCETIPELEDKRRKFCIDEIYKQLETWRGWEIEKELSLIKGFPSLLYSKSHDECYGSFSITEI